MDAMMSEWPIKTIAECASRNPYSTQIGPFGKALMADEYVPSGVPVLRGVNVNQGRFHDGDFVFIREDAADRLSKFESFPGDVLLVHKGTLGQIGLMPAARKYDSYIMGNSMMRVQCDTSKLLPEYLYYWLSSPDGQHYLFSRVSQVGVPQIQTPLTTLREAALPVPSLSEQHAIVQILRALDDKIELNHQMNETLEAIARSIFRSWFIDFDPVHAKIEGRIPLDIDEDTAELFPDSFVESELGRVPEGWVVAEIGEVLEFAYGRALKAELRRPGKVTVMGSNGQIGWHDQALVPGPGIVVGRKGNPGVVSWVDSDFFPIDTTFYVVPRDPALGLHFLFHALQLQDFKQIAADSAVPGLNRNLAYGLSLLLPSAGLVRRFEQAVTPLHQKVAASTEEALTLSALRDSLLPKLISGEIRIKDAEKVAEAAL